MYSILIADDDYYQGVRYMNMEIWGKFGFEVAAAVQTDAAHHRPKQHPQRLACAAAHDERRHHQKRKQ